MMLTSVIQVRSGAWPAWPTAATGRSNANMMAKSFIVAPTVDHGEPAIIGGRPVRCRTPIRHRKTTLPERQHSRGAPSACFWGLTSYPKHGYLGYMSTQREERLELLQGT